MNRYTSPNRIMSPGKISQPLQPGTNPSKKEFYNTKIDTGRKTNKVLYPDLVIPTDKPPVVDFTDPNSVVSAKVAWLKENNYAVLPEITTIKDEDVVAGLALVVAHYGDNADRYKANAKAIDRIMHAKPRPQLLIFVEYVEEGKSSHYADDRRWDVVLTRVIGKDSTYLFQKEAMWTLGGKYAFEQEGITKCIFCDADCAWEDNSWAYYCNNALNKADFIQPYSGIYYSDQEDAIPNYDKYGMYISVAYALTHGLPRGTPGGAYGCTKKFFYDILDSKWPMSSVGSGDAEFWIYLKGRYTMNFLPVDYDFRLSTETGNFPDCKIDCANLIMIHYYHGPMSNRMYRTRNYCVRKCAITPESETTFVDNVLTWADTNEGKISITIAKDPLVIVTYCGHGSGFKESNIINMKRELDRRCKVPFVFYVASDHEIACADKTFIIPTHRKYASGEWNRLHIFGFDFNDSASVLFIDPSVTIIDNFTAAKCPVEYCHMARPYGRVTNKYRQTWDSDIMYFRGGRELRRIYEEFIDELRLGGIHDPEYQFIDPTEYIAYKMRKYKYIRNIIAHFDYVYSNEKVDKEGIEFILEP